MKTPRFLGWAVVAFACVSASGQVVFNENFDGGYSGGFGTNSFQGGSPTGTMNGTQGSGGNPSGCWVETMTATTSGDYYAGQVQIDTVTPNSDTSPSDYILSFDANGSQAANVHLEIQTWPNNYFGGSQVIEASTDKQLTAANTWQTFSVNLGTITSASPVDATWQFNFYVRASDWGGAGHTDTLKIDNIVLTHLANGLSISSSANPSLSGQGVNFTAVLATNGVKAGNATGTVVFASANGPFRTNAMSAGSATSGSLASLPLGVDGITVSYFTGNYPNTTNTFSQAVNPAPGTGETNVPLYTDNLVNGFSDWSWASVNMANTSPTHSGPYSIAVTDYSGSSALSFGRNSDISSAPYTSVTFWINGGGAGGQKVKVVGVLDGNGQGSSFTVPTLPANTWQQITAPLASLGVDNKPNFTGIEIQGRTGSAQATFYVDDVQLVAATPPALVHLGVDASQALRTVDARQFGVNTATWDGVLSSSQTLPLLQQIGCSALRWPGGSTSDEYHWASDASGNATFRNIATNLGAQVFTTINYGTGTPTEAAAWVLNANKTNHCGFKYWEIGNECYGTWETDNHAVPNDPFTYATNAVACIQQMKAAFPSTPIKVGVVAVPGENTFVNNVNHFATNSRTGVTNYGWTPIMLSEMKTLGVLPDFLIYHFYWQYTQAAGWNFYTESPDSDAFLLQVAETPSPSDWSDWASAAASLRQQLTDYVGAAGANIELCVTENNCDAGAMGRESTSLVDALYLADSTGQLMKTEFNSYLWWDLRNGATTDGDLDPTLYGWRTIGDYGLVDVSNNPYPTFYAKKLLQYFAKAGDSVLNGTSDNVMVCSYAVLRTNGALTLLVVNKNMTAAQNAQIALTNYTPWTTATVQSYGAPQDQATETNGAAALQDIATSSFSVPGTNFNYSFPPLSLTLFTFAPGPSTLAAQDISSGNLHLRLQGQAGTYVIQASPDLSAWSPVSTNTLVGSSMVIPIPYSAGSPQEFYRAVWQP